MNQKLEDNLFYHFNMLKEQVKELETEIAVLKQELAHSFNVQRCHLLRVKNGDQLSDEYILSGKLYNDYSPEQAFDLYNEKDQNFILLDVSDKNYTPPKTLNEAIKIPLHELPIRFKEIVNKAVPIFVISEDGTKSILACEILNQCGYFNVNNISGGYKFWPGFRQGLQIVDKKAA
jgi:rhodanese-related sulfurtransferase